MTTIGFKIPEQDHDNTQEMQIPLQDFRHILITGATGSGKTASLILPTLKNRIETNNSIIFLEYKGHEHRKIKYLAEQADRLHDIVELGKPTGTYINIMSLFNSNMIKDTIISLCGGAMRDPYWSTSASQLAIRIIELQRKYQKICQLLIKDFNVKEDFFTLSLRDGLNLKNDYNILRLSEEVSFATLAKIVHSPKSLRHYFSSIQGKTLKIEIIINNLCKKYNQTQSHEKLLQNLLSEFILFSDLVNKYTNFGIEDSDESSGNNGVLQVLQNAISTLATHDYINNSEADILKLIDNNAIIIIDVQSIGSHIYSIFIESLLKRLSGRIKYKIPKEVSIFIDEANRVLTPHIDLQNDTLREARVELVLAVQNEEQMQLKFGETQWESIASNIRQHYAISENHSVSHNGRQLPNITPLLFEENMLDIAEYTYNGMSKNLRYIANRFTSYTAIPVYFKIIYDVHNFFQDSTLELQEYNGETTTIKYIGESVKKKAKKKMDDYKTSFQKVINNSKIY